MSYYFDLSFRDNIDKEQAFELALRAVENLWNDFDSFLEEEKIYIPSVRYSMSADAAEFANREWLEKFGQINFVWWESHKLLAMVGSTWPKSVQELFPKTCSFQNSCDQNYPFETWEGLSPQIMREVKMIKDADAETVARVLHSVYSDGITEEDAREDLDYWRKSAAYHCVYRQLDLDNWLWGKDSDKFMRFTLSCLNSQERKVDTAIKLKAMVRDIYKEN